MRDPFSGWRWTTRIRSTNSLTWWCLIWQIGAWSTWWSPRVVCVGWRWHTKIEEGPTGNVPRPGEPLVLPIIAEEQLVAAARDEEHATKLRAHGLVSVVILPLLARERVLGLLTLVRSDESRAFKPDEL